MPTRGSQFRKTCPRLKGGRIDPPMEGRKKSSWPGPLISKQNYRGEEMNIILGIKDGAPG